MDYFRKGKSLFSTTLDANISTGTSETITLSSVSGLPTDTEITLTFDKVDANGNSTPTKLERIRGTIVGSNLTSYTRGVDGTTEQAHSAGAVIQYIPNAADMNDQVDGILVEHGQDGKHSDITADTITVTGATSLSTLSTSGASDLNSLKIASGSVAIGSIKDEDDMSSDSATALATQQSIKAYVDTPRSARMTLSSTTSNSTPAQVPFNTVSWTDSDYFTTNTGSNAYIKIKKAGKYLVQWHAYITGLDVGQYWYLDVRLNGVANYDMYSAVHSNNVNRIDNHGCALKNFAVDDYVALFTRTGSAETNNALSLSVTYRGT